MGEPDSVRPQGHGLRFRVAHSRARSANFVALLARIDRALSSIRRRDAAIGSVREFVEPDLVQKSVGVLVSFSVFDPAV